MMGRAYPSSLLMHGCGQQPPGVDSERGAEQWPQGAMAPPPHGGVGGPAAVADWEVG
ncbi:hypothetical protein ID866_10595 [Astraeus odoratus]|nr:hypothetical protein ID866_10595 [Astraeus odoratus]